MTELSLAILDRLRQLRIDSVGICEPWVRVRNDGNLMDATPIHETDVEKIGANPFRNVIRRHPELKNKEALIVAIRRSERTGSEVRFLKLRDPRKSILPKPEAETVEIFSTYFLGSLSFFLEKEEE